MSTITTTANPAGSRPFPRATFFSGPLVASGLATACFAPSALAADAIAQPIEPARQEPNVIVVLKNTTGRSVGAPALVFPSHSVSSPNTFDENWTASKARQGVVDSDVWAQAVSEFWKAPLRTKVVGFGHLPDDWDFDNGVAPSGSAVDAALGVIKSLPAAPRPTAVRAIGDGEIVFQWRRTGLFIEVGVQGRTLSWGAEIDGRVTHGDLTYTVGDRLPPGLLAALVAV